MSIMAQSLSLIHICILYREHDLISPHSYRHIHVSSDPVVADRIIAEVKYELLYHILIAVYDAAYAVAGDMDPVIFRIELQHFHAGLRKVIQIHICVRSLCMSSIQF